MEYRCRRRCRSVYVYICSRFPLLSWVFWWVAGATCLARALGTPPHQWTGPVKNAWWSKVGGCAMLQVIAAQHKSTNYVQWEFQDPKMEVLYHIRPYFGGIFPYIGLIYGRYLQFRFLEWPLILVHFFCSTFFFAWRCWQSLAHQRMTTRGGHMASIWRTLWW